MNSARTRAYLMLLIVAVVWGLATPIIKYTLGGFEPLFFLTYRFGVSSLIAVIIAIFAKQHLPKNRSNFLNLLLYGFLTSTVSLGFLFLGIKNTTVLDASLITLASPLLISIAGSLYLKEHITKRERVGMGIAFLGTIVTIIEPIIQNGNGHIRLSGNILIIGYLVATAWGAVIGKKLLRNNVSPLVMTNTSFIVGFITLLPFAIFSAPSVNTILNTPFTYHLGVFYMAILSGTIAYYLSNRAQKTIEISEAGLFSYLFPIFSTPLAILWIGEKITPMFVIGAVIIATGVVIAEVKKKRYNSSSESKI